MTQRHGGPYLVWRLTPRYASVNHRHPWLAFQAHSLLGARKWIAAVDRVVGKAPHAWTSVFWIERDGQPATRATGLHAQ